MAQCMDNVPDVTTLNLDALSGGERDELMAMGILSGSGKISPVGPGQAGGRHYLPVARRAVSAPTVLNEAFDYAKPSSFSRGLRLDLGAYTLLLISGTASVDEEGRTIYPGDFRAQCWRTYRNITELLASEGAGWNDIIRTTCYLRDIERDYKDFNEVRTMFFRWLGLDPLPASTGIQARLCREDLLVEIEAIALFRNQNVEKG
jgi:2-iminobutanoate/2-iminopropanoate deaminase